jgi:hypothetical protein
MRLSENKDLIPIGSLVYIPSHSLYWGSGARNLRVGTTTNWSVGLLLGDTCGWPNALDADQNFARVYNTSLKKIVWHLKNNIYLYREDVHNAKTFLAS